MRHLAQARNPPSVVMDSGLIVSGMTVEEKICFGINLICPVQSRLQKYFRFRLAQITSISIAVPAHRGAFRDRHGRWARDAVDAAALGARWDRRAGFP